MAPLQFYSRIRARESQVQGRGWGTWGHSRASSLGALPCKISPTGAAGSCYPFPKAGSCSPHWLLEHCLEQLPSGLLWGGSELRRGTFISISCWLDYRAFPTFPEAVLGIWVKENVLFPRTITQAVDLPVEKTSWRVWAAEETSCYIFQADLYESWSQGLNSAALLTVVSSDDAINLGLPWMYKSRVLEVSLLSGLV